MTKMGAIEAENSSNHAFKKAELATFCPIMAHVFAIGIFMNSDKGPAIMHRAGSWFLIGLVSSLATIAIVRLSIWERSTLVAIFPFALSIEAFVIGVLRWFDAL